MFAEKLNRLREGKHTAQGIIKFSGADQGFDEGGFG